MRAGAMMLALVTGTPAWAACQSSQQPMVEGIQRELAVNGFDPGGIDGRFGPRTSEAIRQYERAAKLTVTGCPSQELLDHVSFHLPKVYSRVRPDDPTPETEVQAGLTMRGFYVGAVDGRIGERTRAAIRQYQREANLPVDGQVTPELAQRLRDDRATRAR
ncbi:lytic murein transglycosylase [Skermanella stibiiresistens SB22]|uniref:Lytic murein transglycosylase n=1 Tax=Skermanella stibiiresistens SB22 TaxID=1385369 RepID=W9H589_9PROT|nr:lytic murein transglycosylase [Skermanella stibiiresistens SB22]